MNNRRAFLKFGVAGAAGIFALRQALTLSPHEWNERITSKLLGARSLAPVFPKDRAKEPRPNGDIGMDEEVSDWTLKLKEPAKSAQMTIAQVKALPRVEMTTELMCVEGWSEIVTWAGTPLSNIMPANSPDYVGLSTPDENYYVSIDRESAMHPQTLLAWEMNGEPLNSEHGAPLRLVIPVKYGIKNIKRIGTIEFTNTRPKDYWQERGYDWYSAL